MNLIIAFVRSFALALFCWSVPTGLKAESVAVRSGEHEGFTRIVLDLPSPRGWTLEQDKNSARLVLKGSRVRFDLSDAFRKIGTARVGSLRETKDANALAIDLNCDCKVEAFRLGPRMLVIDIKDGAAVARAPLRLPGAPGATSSVAGIDMASRSAIESAFPFDVTRHTGRTPLEFSIRTDAMTQQRHKTPTTPTKAAASTVNAPVMSQKLERDKRISESERRLAEQLSRAVSQGLITPRAARLPQLKPQAATGPESTMEPKEQASPDRKVRTPGLNLRAETSADRDFLKALDALAMTRNGDACLSPDQLDIPAWGGDQPFSQAVGTYRGALVGEFDRPNMDVARKLARFYLHYGFGAEALHVLKVSQLTDGDFALLQSLGEIMENGHARSPAAFANQFDCDTPAALWAALAHENIPDAAEINTGALLRAINELPPHLRSLLGPLVIERLRLVRREDLAGQVLRLVERGAATPDSRLEMARSEQKLAEGDITSASDSLSNVVDSNTDLSPMALVKLVDARLSARLPLDAATAELAGAYAQEYRRQPLGIELKRVHILALSEAGAYDLAFAELSRFSSHASPETIAELRSHALSALAEKSGDQLFLKHALGIEKQALSTLRVDSANAVAQRLITLGFAARADRYLQGMEDSTTNSERRLLRARAALAQMKPRRAEEELLGLTGSEADMIRARARSMEGDHQAAQQLFAALEQTDRMIEEAWLAGDWTTLRDSSDAFWVDVADMALPAEAEPALPDAETGALARNRALLTQSAATRATLDGLLARYPFEQPPPPTN